MTWKATIGGLLPHEDVAEVSEMGNIGKKGNERIEDNDFSIWKSATKEGCAYPNN